MRAWWTVRQLAEQYGMSVRSIYDAIAAGQLVVHRFGRGRGGMRVSDEHRLEWEERCQDARRAPAPPTSKGRRFKLDLVQKHFGP